LNRDAPNPEVAPRRWRRLVLAGCLAAFLAMVAFPVSTIALGHNFHTLLPGRVYRSAQLNEADLKRVIQKHGIRTIVNLRGLGLGMDWYHGEWRAAHQGNIAMEDIGLSAGRLPPVSELRYLVRVLDESEYPILIHCKQGIDRTGLTSALILLLCTDTDLPTARRQLSLCYGHLSLGRTAYMGRFFDLYEQWLAGRGERHSRERFRHWLEREYTAGPAAARLEWLDWPVAVPRGQPWAARVRAQNTSAVTWHFQPGSSAGVHGAFMLIDAKGKCRHKGRAGLLRADVPPGQSIDLTLVLPPLPAAGTYYLFVDMQDEAQQSYFYQHGSQPLVRELEVGPEE
jgi:protein tyrosine phosphatase (PTP) superfamily phosphohydrolase (DUF442 family)